MTPESGSEPKFWQISLANLEQRLGADRNSLSSAEVAARRLRYSPNTLEEASLSVAQVPEPVPRGGSNGRPWGRQTRQPFDFDHYGPRDLR